LKSPRSHLRELLEQALVALRDTGDLALDALPPVPVERARDERHGDFASPVALGLARAARAKPREIAERIVARLPDSDLVARVEIAGPGFINFFLAPHALRARLLAVLEEGERYGRSSLGAARPVQVEFVSANPTGPLHVGHGRGAAYGACVANLLEAVGFAVQREYLVNDAGRQIDVLGVSTWLRYLERCGETLAFPDNGYRGEYVREIAEALHAERGETLRVPAAEIEARANPGTPPGTPDGSEGRADPEQRLSALIAAAKASLGDERYRAVSDFALARIVDDIRDDLAGFGVHHDRWFSERSLWEAGAVDAAIERLRDSGHLYQREGAWWFRSTGFGDEKDRVVLRANGQATYFASDVAYHLDKFERGYEQVIDVWGADHHGHVPRMRGALAALGEDPERLEVMLVQFAQLYRGERKVPMSTRSGEFVTLRELRGEVGDDAARFFYVMRKSDAHLDFDLDLAKSRSRDNPVYYVQYAHARVCSVLRQLGERGLEWDAAGAGHHLDLLVEPREAALVGALDRYPETVETAALAREPHQIAFFLRELANLFHTWYDSHQILAPEAGLRSARLALALAARQVIRNGLGLLGVSAPETM